MNRVSLDAVDYSVEKKSESATLKRFIKSIRRDADLICRFPGICYKTAIASSRQPDVVFVWIPKTAGTSLFTALEQHLGMVNLCESLHYVKAFKNRGGVTFGHFDYKALLDAGYVSRAFHEKAFKFCVVRDPYDRALSLYYYLRRKKGRSSMDLLAFLNAVHRNRQRIGLYNYQGLSQTNPQVDWLIDDDGSFLVDKIYRFEVLGRIQDEFRKMFNLAEFNIGHTNQVKRDRASEEILTSHSEIIPLIEEIYARDFQLLDYPRKSATKSA